MAAVIYGLRPIRIKTGCVIAPGSRARVARQMACGQSPLGFYGGGELLVIMKRRGSLLPVKMEQRRTVLKLGRDLLE
eukprot:scaffold68935_cov75-Phaeocystis_antarctica.AAC.1